MKIFFVGDACSGKTTILRRLKEEGYPVLLEEGWQAIPPEIEADKFQSFIWFTNYYYNREKLLGDKTIIIERPLLTHYPYAKAQFFSWKITEEQYQKEIAFLDTKIKKLPLDKDILVFHFICTNEKIRERLEARGRKQNKEQERYWDFMRQFTEEYFKRYRDHPINTDKETSDKVYTKIKYVLQITLSS